MNELDKIFSQSKHASTFATGYLNYLNQVLSGFNVEEISAFVRILVDARERDAQMFFMGNGGSATTAVILPMILLLEHGLGANRFEQ